ncbi:histidine phosphatase family protein [Candidatus Woesearchaeota archaeon]|nr:histidine phosphatase family protein [Candidatus Woesearchaeota archaeon]
MEIIMVRHGKTIFADENRFEGCSSVNPLTDEGVKYAKDAGNYLKSRGVTAIYSSPLARAKQTADIISDTAGIPVKTDERLREICYGSWEGKAKSEVEGSQEWKERQNDKYNYIHPGKNSEGHEGESYGSAEKRAKLAFEEIKKEGGTAVVVCHIGIIRVARRIFENIPEKDAADFWITADEIYNVKLNGDAKAEVVKFR